MSVRYFLLHSLAFCLGFSFASAGIYTFREPSSEDTKENHLAALEKALSKLKDGDALVFPPGDYRFDLKKGAQLKVPSGATLQGISGKTRFLLGIDATKGKGHREFLRFQSGTAMNGISIKRIDEFPLVMFPLFGEIDNVTFENCVIDGGKEECPAGYCHILQVGVGKVTGLTLRRCTIKHSNYGLFQTNTATGSLSDSLFEHCLFESNHSSDLEFNSPRGTMKNIVVRDCLFRNNRCQSASAGFAVGFANVRDSSVVNCVISNYQSEALHVEDRSENILLSNNTITSASTRQDNGVIMILSDSKNVTVENNVIDGRNNPNRAHLILITAGGPKFANPSRNKVRKNILLHGPSTRTWYLQPGSTSEKEGNVVVEHGD